jgi:MoaA/NifB/PqqE/SkfB family radical SAM enzyme
LIRLCEKMGITCLLTLYSHSRGSKSAQHPPTEVSKHLLRLKGQHRHFVVLRDYVARFSEAIATGGIGPCFAGRNLCNIDSQGNVTFCIDRLDDVVGNILAEDMRAIMQRLLEVHRTNTCRDCWTSCRGSIESVLYGQRRLLNLLDYYQMTRPIRLGGGF